MATYLADQVIVYSGEASVKCKAASPVSMVEGMNTFLADLYVALIRFNSLGVLLFAEIPKTSDPESTSQMELAIGNFGFYLRLCGVTF
jgi:translation initiation factor RLI1